MQPSLVQPSLFLPAWLLAFTAGRRENDPVVRQTVSLQREREREDERGKRCEGALVTPERPAARDDWLPSEGGEARGFTCSGVSSIA